MLAYVQSFALNTYCVNLTYAICHALVQPNDAIVCISVKRVLREVDCEAPRVQVMEIGWVGLARMGYPMAERLAKAGADVSVYNRTRAKAEPLTRSGIRLADRQLEACDD